MKRVGYGLIAGLGVATITFFVYGCSSSNSSTSASEDSSGSGAIAGVVGGALSGSNSSGTQASLAPKYKNTLEACVKNIFEIIPDAYATTACPTFKTTSGGCTASGSSLWLAYNSCSFGTSSSTWTGTQLVSMSTGSAACGTFPNPGANGTLLRQFVTAVSGTTPGTAKHTSAAGTVTTLDDATTYLGNFNSDGNTVLPAIANGGYGTQVTFNSSGARSGITIGRHLYITGKYDHSVYGSLTVTETAGASTRTVSGSMKVYHNLLKVIGTATLTGVTHTDTCCTPTAGTISTVWAAGSNVAPTTAGSKLVGNTETLTITGCGTGTLVDTAGTSTNVTLRCF